MDSQKNKNILHISTGLGLGGAESLLFECALAGRVKGYDPTVVSLKSGGQYVKRFIEKQIPTIELDAKPNSFNVAKLIKLRAVINSTKPDIIQTWMYHANLFGLLATLITNSIKPNKLVWGIFAAKTDMKSYGKSTSLVNSLSAKLSSLPAGIIYNADSAANDHKIIGYSPNKTIVINNGINIDKFKPDIEKRNSIRKKLKISESETVVIISARNHPQKDWTSALSGVCDIPNVTTIAVGEGTEHLPEQPSLIRLGSRHDMPELYAASDIFLLPSAFGEGTSVAMCEAMASGLPIIVTDIGDNAVLGKQAGYVVNVGAASEIRTKIIEIIENDNLRKKFSINARKIIVDHYSSNECYQQLFNFYESIMLTS